MQAEGSSLKQNPKVKKTNAPSNQPATQASLPKAAQALASLLPRGMTARQKLELRKKQLHIQRTNQEPPELETKSTTAKGACPLAPNELEKLKQLQHQAKNLPGGASKKLKKKGAGKLDALLQQTEAQQPKKTIPQATVHVQQTVEHTTSIVLDAQTGLARRELPDMELKPPKERTNQVTEPSVKVDAESTVTASSAST